ncbi:filaggrin-2 [Lycaon pictus]
MANRDPQYKGDRELLMDNQETPLQMPSLVMEKPARHSPLGLVEDLVSVSPVTLRGTQESDSHTQVPSMARLDLNIQNWVPQLKGDRELLMDSPETPVDMPTLAMDKPQRHNPAGLVEGNLASLSPVTLKTTQVSHRHTQDPRILTLVLNIQSQDPHYKGDKEQLMDNQETPLHMPSLVMDKPAGHNPVGVEEVSLLSVSPVTLRGTQEPHRHTQDTLMVMLDLNIQNWVPQLKGDREHIMDSQKISVHMPTLAMDRPPGHYPVGLVEGNLVAATRTQSSRTGRRETSGSESSDTERHSGVPQAHSGSPRGQAGSQHGESGSSVQGRQGTTHGQSGDTTTHAQSGHGQATRTQSSRTRRRGSTVNESSDTQGHPGVPQAHTGSPQSHSGSQHGESGSSVQGRQGTTHRQSGDTGGHVHSGHGEATRTQSSRTGRRESTVSESSDSQGHSGAPQAHTGSPHGQAGSQHPELGSTVKGRQGTHYGQSEDFSAHAHSQDPHYKGERKLLIDSQETLLDMRTLAMDKPPGHNPVGLVEGKLVALSPVTLKIT